MNVKTQLCGSLSHGPGRNVDGTAFVDQRNSYEPLANAASNCVYKSHR